MTKIQRKRALTIPPSTNVLRLVEKKVFMCNPPGMDQDNRMTEYNTKTLGYREDIALPLQKDFPCLDAIES
jgi:hypothetical protein